MEIETADVEDVPAITDCWVALADDQRRHGSHVLSEKNRQRISEELARHASTGRLFVAREGGAVVGFVEVATERGTYEKDCERGIIEAIYVVPERRGEGVGSSLLTKAESTLESMGVEYVTLEALAANDGARRFYRRHGYTVHRVGMEKPVKSDNHSKEGE